MKNSTSAELIATDCWRVGFPALLLATVRTNIGLYSGEVAYRPAADAPSRGAWYGSVDVTYQSPHGPPVINQHLELTLRCEILPPLPIPVMGLRYGTALRPPITPRSWNYHNPEWNIPLCMTYVVQPAPDIGSREPFVVVVTDLAMEAQASEPGPVKTPCDCAAPGHCPRHHCEKTFEWHRLCQMRPDYFQAWEQGGGPGRYAGEPIVTHQSVEPGLFQKAWNLATATAAFIADGFQTVDQVEYARRLAICDTCEQRHESKCLACGCNLVFKARARAMQCPLGKWTNVPPPTGTTNPPPLSKGGPGGGRAAC